MQRLADERIPLTMCPLSNLRLHVVDDLARAMGVSIRSLQYGFRHFLDISPADHIRNVRLERARRDLLDLQDSPLAEIAGRWGFANLARFNARFRNAFGETPAAYRRRREGLSSS